MDTGLLQRLLNLDMDNVLLSTDINLVNKGTLAEVFVGLELLKYGSCYERQNLYYWLRLEKALRPKLTM